MSTEPQQPWERREEETSKAYRAFCIYRDIGPARSLPKAWDVYRNESGLKAVDPTGTFKDWCSGNDWVARSKAWDDYEEEQRRLAREHAREEARELFASHAQKLARKLLKVAMGEEANRDQVKAILEALDRAGVTVPKEMKVEHSGPEGGPISITPAILADLAQMTVEEKAAAFKDLVGGQEDDRT